tara:strand:- start:17003 stop:18367 length:1365 start_codon:yes stop_codon:yes gene_type:complete
MKSKKYDCDLFVIGAGSGGVRAARLASQSGAEVIIAEQSRIGGTCVIRGCIPKKLLSYSSKFSKINKISNGYGWNYSNLDFSWSDLITNKNKEIERLSQIYRNNLQKSGVNIIEESAKIIDKETVAVGNNRKIKTKNILIASGASPFVPNIQGAEHAITSNDFFELDHLPKKIIIVGGGYIALELASMVRGFGADCSIVYRGSRLLRGFDNDVGKAIEQEFHNQGIDVGLNKRINKITKNKSFLQVHFDDGAKENTNLVLFATGRMPNINCLANNIIKTDSNMKIKVNRNFQTSVSNIYAIGDVSNSYHLTPVAIREAMIFVRNKYQENNINYKITNVPTAIFTNPEIATVGLSEIDALQKYKKIDIYHSVFRSLYYSLSDYNQKTMIKIIVDSKSDRVVGFHMIGDDSAEIVQMMSTLMNKKVTKTELDITIPLHPTVAEEIMTLKQKIIKEI